VKVDICIVTYRRPQGLLRLLGAIQELHLPDPAPDLRVVVVDNDAAESARRVCAEAHSWLRHRLVYAVEKRRGIPQARNTAIAASLSHADFLAFIDDDEVPEPGWLAELLRVQASRNAEAVAGPCLPLFEEPPPAWIERGGFFQRPRHTTGALVDTAFTHNVLVSTRALAGLDALFDERMALIGGSDSELFDRLAAGGRRIVWADEAVVSEWVPPSRARLAWLLRRSFRVGSSSAFVDRRRAEGRVSPPVLLAHGCWCLAKGTLGLLLVVSGGRVAAGRGLRLAAFGAGRIAGLFGVMDPEYRSTHGA
jgi:glycosyltransferase involved in cell wall biosynthesis